MINEILDEKEIRDENKLLEAIHRQAKDAYYFEKRKAYLKKCKKKNTSKILEIIVCSVLVILPMAFMLFALIIAN